MPLSPALLTMHEWRWMEQARHDGVARMGGGQARAMMLNR